MRIKSHLLSDNQSIALVETIDAYTKENHFEEKQITIKNEDIQNINSSILIAEGIVISDLQMRFSTPQKIETEIIGESIIMHFICGYNVKTTIDDLVNTTYNSENTHNILYGSNLKATFDIPPNEEINYLSIILSLDYYYKVINKNWDLHKEFSKNIQIQKTSYLHSTHIPFSPNIQWIIHEIKNCKYEGAVKKIYLESKIKELLITQLESITPKSKTKKTPIEEEDYIKLQEAKLILDNNFTHAPSLPELSRAISLNEFKLKKGFKACFSITVKGYVTKLRMEYAKHLFKKNDTTTVGEVAYKCGYKDVSHFSATFKLFYGFTPISFRNMNLKLHLIYWGFEEFLPLFLYNS